MGWPQFLKRAAFVFLLTALACSQDFELPTGPPAAGVGGIGGYVFAGADGNCLVGARIEIIDGARAGEAIQQSDCPFGDGWGYSFYGLPTDKKVTIRASATGYKSSDIQKFPSVYVGQTSFILTKE